MAFNFNDPLGLQGDFNSVVDTLAGPAKKKAKPKKGKLKSQDKQSLAYLNHKEVLTEAEVASLWLVVGGPSKAAAMSVAVANHESARKRRARSSAGATGIWQIHPGGPQYENVFNNAEAAVGKYNANGWQPWSVCNSTMDGSKEGDKDCPNLAKEAARIQKRLGIDTSQDGILDVAGKSAGSGIETGIDGLIKPIEAIANFFGLLAQADTWIRVLKVLGGVVLLGLALYWIIKG